MRSIFIILPLFIAVFIAFTGCKGQQPPLKKYSLLTWEYRRDGEGVVPIENAMVLAKYIYSDTGYLRKEIFKTSPYSPHYSDYETKIYDNRYLINSMGDIYDLDSNKIIHDHIGYDHFIEKSGDSVFMRHIYYEPDPTFHKDSIRHQSIKTGYYYFDLRTRKIVQLEKYGIYHDYNSHTAPLFGIYNSVAGVFSPDRKWLAYFKPKSDAMNYDYMKDTSYYLCGWTRMFPTYGDLFIRSSANDSLRIADPVRFDFGIWTSNTIPVLWLNNNELLTQEKKGRIIKITINPYSITRYPELDNVAYCGYPARFEVTAAKDTLYFCPTSAGEMFRINTTTNTLLRSQRMHLSSRYSIETFSSHPNMEYVKGYFYDNKKILDDTTATIHHSITPDDLLAIQCKEVTPSRNQYDHWNTIKIFDPFTSKRVSVKVEYLKRLIGWVKEN